MALPRVVPARSAWESAGTPRARERAEEKRQRRTRASRREGSLRRPVLVCPLGLQKDPAGRFYRLEAPPPPGFHPFSDDLKGTGLLGAERNAAGDRYAAEPKS